VLGRAVNEAEQAAALQVGPDHRRDRLRTVLLIAEAQQRNRQLGRPDAGDLDSKLGQGRQSDRGYQGA